MDKYLIEGVIRKRANKVLKILKDVFGVEGSFYIGGNCLNSGKFSDIDVFPMNNSEVMWINGQKIVSTRNADTYKQDKYILQICKYYKKSLEDMINSFDFAHIQVGVEIKNNQVEKVFFTENYVNAHVVGDTWFVGSEYPLSSLVRTGKYYKKSQISRGQQIYSTLTSLIAVIERGFKDYEDFKDQLDAIDLGLVPEELDDVCRCNLLGLFHFLERNKNGKTKRI